MEEEQQKQTKQRGGRREGSGRKAKGGENGTYRIAFKTSKDIYDILKEQRSMTAYIEAAIREKRRREGRY